MRWSTSTLPPKENQEILDLCKGTFTYLGSENPCYAFGGEDGLYVLKFFKQKYMRTPSPLPSLPLLREKKNRGKKERDKTSHLNTKVTLVDQHGTPIEIDIDQMDFLIQKKGELVFDHLTRQKKRITDRDLQLYKNFGFVGNQPFEIDMGGFNLCALQNDPEMNRQEVLTVYTQLHNWICVHYPHLTSQLERVLAHVCE